MNESFMNDLLIFSLSILITSDNYYKNKANFVLFIVSYWHKCSNSAFKGHFRV